jgi:hypothetical protein
MRLRGSFYMIFPRKTKGAKDVKQGYFKAWRALHRESEVERVGRWQRENVERVKAKRRKNAARRLKEIGLGDTQ